MLQITILYYTEKGQLQTTILLIITINCVIKKRLDIIFEVLNKCKLLFKKKFAIYFEVSLYSIF